MELQDGNSGNPFFSDSVSSNKFTVAASLPQSDPANMGTTDGTKDGDIWHWHRNLDWYRAEDVTYSNRYVRPDAVGDIHYRDTVVIFPMTTI